MKRAQRWHQEGRGEPPREQNWHIGSKTWTWETWEESAGPLYPVADGLAAVKVWAETIMRTRLEAMRAGKLDELEAVVAHVRALRRSE